MLNNLNNALRIRIPPLVRTGGATQPATQSPAATPRPTNGTPAYESNSPAYSPTSPAYESNSPAYSPTSPPYDPALNDLGDLEPFERRAWNGTPVYTNDSPAYSPTSPPYDPPLMDLGDLEPLDINMDPELDPFRDLEPIMDMDPIQLVLDSVEDSFEDSFEEVQYVRTVRASQMQGSVTMRATRNQWEEIMSTAEGARCPLCLEDLESMTEMAELSCTYDAETGGKHFMCTACAETMQERHRADPSATLKCYTCAQEVSTVYVNWVRRKRPRADSEEDSSEDKRSRVA